MKTKVKEIHKEKRQKKEEIQKCKTLRNNHKGITLIALVITIVVLLILASVSIAMLTGDNGILTKAGDAKIETALGAVKEQVRLYQIEKKMNEQEVTAESLLAEGKVSRTVQAGEDDKYYMYYALKENSFEGMQGLGKGNIASLKDVFLIDDNLNVKYISSDGKEYGDNLNNKILEDETEIRFSSKAFSEYVSKISGVTEDEMKFKWMKNQTSLTISDQNVNSLQDLVFFPNLLSLQLGTDYAGKDSPNITSMEGIENCRKLSSLTIIGGPNKNYEALSKLQNLENFMKYGGSDYENIIDSLSLCNNLKSVECRGQNITTTKKFSKLNNIERLNISNNAITKIEGLENMINLKYLNLSGNQISKIEGINNLTNLTELIITNNSIVEIEGLDNLIKLNKLYLNSNKIKDITPLSKNIALTYLNLQYNPDIDENRNNYTGERLEALNKIGEILDRGGEIQLSVSKLKLFNNYTKLNLSGQNLTTLEPLEGLTQLTFLNLTGNKLTLEDAKSQEILKSMTKLQHLYLNNNCITNIKAINDLKGLLTLEIVGSSNNVNLVEIEDRISQLNNLRINQTSLNTLKNCNSSKITKLSLKNSDIMEMPDISNFNNLKTLELNGCYNINNFDIISKFTSLNSLSLAQTKLHGKSINFENMTNLKSLSLNNCELWSEDLNNLKMPKNNINLSIDLSKNMIINATPLIELDSSTKINLSNNINLSQDSKDKLKAKFGNNVTF